MHDEVLVRGFWGPRAEDDGELARRLGAFLGLLGGLCHVRLDGWKLPKGDRLKPEDPAWLADHIRRAAEATRAEDLGLGILQVVSAVPPSGAKFVVTVSAGQTSSVAALQNSVVVELSPPRGAEEAEWRTVARHVLPALSEMWDPDWGDVAAVELWTAVEGLVKPRERAPETGYAIYLSAARWAAARQAAVPDTWREELPGGGGVLSPVPEQGGAWPSAGQVVALDRALDAAGALGMTPVDAPRFGDPPLPGSGYIAVAGTRAEPDIKLSLKYRPVAVNAPRFAEGIVAAAREISGVELDYSPASLREVDRIIEEMRRDGAPAEAVGETLLGFGAYLGELLVRHAGGRWVDVDEARGDDFGQALVVEMPGGVLWNPLGKAFKRFGAGDAESLESFYEQAARLTSDPAGRGPCDLGVGWRGRGAGSGTCAPMS